MRVQESGPDDLCRWIKAADWWGKRRPREIGLSRVQLSKLQAFWRKGADLSRKVMITRSGR